VDPRVQAVVAAIAIGATADPPETTLFTAPQGDGWRSAIDPPSVSLSADGRFIAFTSYERLAPADRNDVVDIYVLDRDTGLVTIESLAADGDAPRIHAQHGRISGDGRFVLFESIIGAADASAMKAGEGTTDDLMRSHIVLRDRSSGSARVISVDPNGKPANAGSRSPAISRDGRLAAFVSAATNLVAGDDANGKAEDIYVVDLSTGAVSRASVDSAGRQSHSGSSFDPSLSADGRYVVFTSTAPLGGGTQRMCQVYVRDLVRAETSRVSVARPAEAPNGRSAHATISDDGRYIAFASEASNLTRDDRNRAADVFLYDRIAGTTTLVSRSVKRGAANGASGNPAISADGRLVVFQSEASDLVCAARCTAREDFNLVWDVFVFDRHTGIISVVSGDPKEGWIEPSSGPAIDASGQVLAFSSRHPIDAQDSDGDLDLFIRVAVKK
jgi:Tol biopolymer transport system component